MAKMRAFGGAKDLFLPKSEFLNQNRTILSMLADPEIRANAHVLDLAPWFCPRNRCEFVKDGHPMLLDTAHLTKSASLGLADALSPLFAKTDAAAPPAP